MLTEELMETSGRDRPARATLEVQNHHALFSVEYMGAPLSFLLGYLCESLQLTTFS